MMDSIYQWLGFTEYLKFIFFSEVILLCYFMKKNKNHTRRFAPLIAIYFWSFLLLCSLANTQEYNATLNFAPQLIDSTISSVFTPNTFAVIGDYGLSGPNEAAVAQLVKSWNPEYIITLGDNNYPEGATGTIDANIGQYYHDYIQPYVGSYGNGADTNRFFPCLGNHDWVTAKAQPYLNYFKLPGNERYYDYTKGSIHFFVLDADPSEPDGVSKTSVQAVWLKNKLANSTEKWKIVYFHQSPYCSDAVHGDEPYMQWPFKTWGADIVLSGHSHIYERVIRDSFPYLVNGLGGQVIYDLAKITQGSQVRYNSNFGAMRVSITPDTLWFRFYTVSNVLIDAYPLIKNNSTDDIIKISYPKNSNKDRLINVYPNPSTGLFTFEICLKSFRKEIFDIKIINAIGEPVYSKTVEGTGSCIKKTIELESSLITGVYFLQIKTGNYTESTEIILDR
jgi:tartrate-resistant acid phosphatase type 5